MYRVWRAPIERDDIQLLSPFGSDIRPRITTTASSAMIHPGSIWTLLETLDWMSRRLPRACRLSAAPENHFPLIAGRTAKPTMKNISSLENPAAPSARRDSVTLIYELIKRERPRDSVEYRRDRIPFFAVGHNRARVYRLVTEPEKWGEEAFITRFWDELSPQALQNLILSLLKSSVRFWNKRKHFQYVCWYLLNNII